jgi:hypothetical protein
VGALGLRLTQREYEPTAHCEAGARLGIEDGRRSPPATRSERRYFAPDALAKITPRL